MGLMQARLELRQDETAIRFRPLALARDQDHFEADLCVPEAAWGLLLLARDPDTGAAAEWAHRLIAQGMGLLRVDPPDEAPGARHAQEAVIGPWAGRLIAAARWARTRSKVCDLPLGLLGMQRGAAAAIEAAAALDTAAGALLVLDARVDLASRAALALNRVPTLMLVSGRDATGSDPAAGMRHSRVHRMPAGTTDSRLPASRTLALAQSWLTRTLRPAGPA